MWRPAPLRASGVLRVLLLGGLAGCGGEGVPGAPPLQRLWELEAELDSGVPPVEASEPVFAWDFSSREERTGLDGWERIVDPEDPLRELPEAFDEALRGEGYLSLSGRRGGMYRILRVEPGGYYEFTGRVRTLELVPEVGEFFHGATFYLGELSRFGTPAELLPEFESLATRHRTLPGTRGTTEWIEKRCLFQVGPATRSLLVCCVLGLSEEVQGGEVHFDDIELRAVSRETYWAVTCEKASRERDPDARGWRARRLIRQALGGESRPSLVLLPGEELGVELTLPSPSPQLEFGAGAWWSDHSEVGLPDPALTILVDGEELWSARTERPEFLHETRWREERVSLAPWAGRRVTLTLRAEDSPGVFGGMLVRETSRRPVGPNLILISIDTLRSDRVGAYGHDGGTTPNLDELARTGLLVRDFTAQSPYTLPSHVSMFSGQFPSVHGVLGPGYAIAAERTPMLAEVLGGRGYTTRAFTAGGFVNPSFGFDRGFDAYSNLDPFRYEGSPHAAGLIERRPERYSQELFRSYGPHAIEEWIGDHAKESFFLFLHSYTVHDFDPPPGFLPPAEDGERIDPQPYMHHEYVREHGITPAILEDIKEYYDAALRYVDGIVGELLEELEELGIADRTVVAVTSDHGKELGERGLIIHGTTLYEEMTQVPFIVRVPGMSPREADQPGMLIDVAPTVLGALGIPADPRMQGRNLLLEGGGAPRFIWSEIDQLAHKYALRAPSGWKIIHGPQEDDLYFPNERAWELYDLGGDPGEVEDALAGDPERTRDLQRRLEENLSALRRFGETLGERGAGDLDEETTEMLRQLGYIGGPGE